MSYLTTATEATFSQDIGNIQASPVFTSGREPSDMLQLKNEIASALRTWFPTLDFDVEYSHETKQYYFYIKDFDFYFTSEFDKFLNEALSSLTELQLFYFEFMPGSKPGSITPEEVTLPKVLATPGKRSFIGHTFTLDQQRPQEVRDSSLDWMAA